MDRDQPGLKALHDEMRLVCHPRCLPQGCRGLCFIDIFEEGFYVVAEGGLVGLSEIPAIRILYDASFELLPVLPVSFGEVGDGGSVDVFLWGVWIAAFDVSCDIGLD